MQDADVATLNAVATSAAFPRFYVKRTQLPDTTSVLSIPDGPDIALVVDCVNLPLTTLAKLVRAFIRELPPEFVVRSAIHATASVYVLTVTRLAAPAQPEPFVPPQSYASAPAISNPHTVRGSIPNVNREALCNPPPASHTNNGNNRRKLVFTDLAQAVKSVEKFVSLNSDALEHDDERLVDYAVGQPDNGGWDELEVTFHSQQHNVHVTYFVEFNSDLTVATFVVSPTYECRACHQDWSDSHPAPPL